MIIYDEKLLDCNCTPDYFKYDKKNPPALLGILSYAKEPSDYTETTFVTKPNSDEVYVYSGGSSTIVTGYSLGLKTE